MKRINMKMLGLYSFGVVSYLLLGYLIGITRGVHTVITTPLQDGILIVLLFPVAYYLFKNLLS